MYSYEKKTNNKKPHPAGKDNNSTQFDEFLSGVGNQNALNIIKASGNFNSQHGTELHLPEELKSRMEARFGFNLSGVRFRESSEVRELGTKAVAQGNTISFAPGVFDPTTMTGREIIGHEMAHVVQQAKGQVNADIPGTNIALNPSLEHSADFEGSMAAIDTGTSMAAQAPLMSLDAAPVSSAPMQGKDWLDKLKYYGSRLLNLGRVTDDMKNWLASGEEGSWRRRKAMELAQKQVDKDFEANIKNFMAEKREAYLPENIDISTVNPDAVETATRVLGEIPFLQPSSIHAIHGLDLELQDRVNQGLMSARQKKRYVREFARNARETTLRSQQVGLIDPYSYRGFAGPFRNFLFQAADSRQREAFRQEEEDRQRQLRGELTPLERLRNELDLTDKKLIDRSEKPHKAYLERLRAQQQ